MSYSRRIINLNKNMIDKFHKFIVEITHGIIHKKTEAILAFVVVVLIVIFIFSIIIKIIV